MKILITGGGGFIGSNLLKHLVAQGHQLIVLDNFSPQVHGDLLAVEHKKKILSAYADIHVGDIRDYETVVPMIKQADIVVHLVAETGVGQSMYECCRYVSVNDLGTATLVEALVKEKHQVQKVILTSSRAVYGECAYRNSQNEIVIPPARTAADMVTGLWEPQDLMTRQPLISIPTPVNLSASPTSIYGVTKYSQELLVGVLSEILGLSVIILRLFNVYGEGQSLQNPYTGILTVFSNLIRSNIPPSLYEDGQESRDFVHVADVVQAIERAILVILPGKSVFNVGSGERITVSELCHEMICAYQADLKPVISGEFRIGDIRHAVADISFSEKLLGYHPTVTLKDGINRFVAWTKLTDVGEKTIFSVTEELKRYGMFGKKEV